MTCKNLLYKILTRQYDFCCLCHKEIKENAVHIEDEVIIKNTDGENSLKILEMLQYTLGSDTYKIISGFDNICKKCTSSAVKSYKFIKTTKEATNIISSYVNGLLSSLNNENCIDILFNKSMFITYDQQNQLWQHYFEKNLINSKSSAVNKLNAQIDSTDTNIELKSDIADFLETEKIYDGNISKKKRKHYAYSVAIKTTDMLYNKNDRTKLQCKTCLKHYPSLSNLRNHFIRVHAPKKYQCSICDRKFGSMALVEAHENESHCTLVCKQCGKTFYNRHTLKMHEVGHYLRIVCPDCGRVYKSRSTYKKHIDLKICGQKTRASPANAKFTCDYCNKKYTQKVSLRVHIQYEHGNYKSHECKWCKKKFWAQSRLKAHIVKHTQEKNFSCPVCGGKFVTKESLLYHTRIHTGEKPYKCEFCDERFLSSSRRADHTKRHHSNSIFQCKICNIKYATQICLQKHMKTHNNEDKVDVAQPSNKTNNIHVADNSIYFDISEEEMF